MKKIIFLVLVSTLVSIEMFAANFRATLDRNPVSVGERFRVTFEVDANGSNFKGPNFAGFKLLGGPSTNRSMSYVNGTMTSSMSYTYVLAAIKEGTYTIPPATIKVKGKTLKSNSLKVQVLPESEAQKKQRQAKEQREKTMSEQAREIIGKNLFVRLSVNKTNVYQGEPLTAVYKIYRHPELDLAGLSPENSPVFNGFWTQEFDISNYDWQWDEVNGVKYLSSVVKKVVLIPQQTGKLIIEPFKFNCTANLQVQGQSNRRRSIFDDPFFSRNTRQFDYLASSGKKTINVKPLPEPVPDSFTGTVGKVKMETWFDVTETKAGEPVTLKVRLTGKGNLRMMQSPKVEFPPDFEVYEPKLSDNTSVTATTISGNVLYEYLAIPRNPGQYKMGPVEFTYFDTEKKKYEKLESEVYTVNVAKGDGKAMQNMAVGANKEDVEILNSDIKYIHTDTNLKEKSNSFLNSGGFFAALLTPFVLFPIILIIRKKRQSDFADVVGMKNKKAAKLAKKRLSTAQTLMKAGEEEKFFEELIKALWGYLSDKLRIPTADLTKDNVAEILTQQGVEEAISSSLLKTMEECEFARYAPIGDIGEMMKDTYAKAESLIITIENKI